ncbi:(2Fe-2S)-binding protein [Pedobacter sp. BS3]|uniref:2Fe-2S iron-sulfur cluster-binding protein n=1 Tax=Pedobacter sp. BS3 TaxID=2567937 RepID=UPI0011ED52AF|nr:2Fe-2S iron-sulfur cluster-binding protein [Pedobacter sp. BS3]TZF84035.1 (2Fe-2S)-binding protein [Pedobacter sp. BS3]
MEHIPAITFTIIYSGREHSIQTRWGEYRDLRALINDTMDVDDFGQCGGTGRCATCLVEITNSKAPLPPRQRNEQTSIEKAGIANPNVRLSCQVYITDDLDGAVVRIT